MTYVRLKPNRSWHLTKAFIKTLCGRPLPEKFEHAEELPVNEKSCERCLQLEARR